MKKAAIIVAALVITLVQLAEQRSTAQLGVGTGQTSTANNAKVDPLIVNHFNLRGGLKPIPVVITYKAMPSSSDLNRLQLAGITKGIKMRELPIVIAPMNAAQLASVKTHPGVKSIWANRIMKPFTNESRRLHRRAPNDGRPRCATRQLPESRHADLGKGCWYRIHRHRH